MHQAWRWRHGFTGIGLAHCARFIGSAWLKTGVVRAVRMDGAFTSTLSEADRNGPPAKPGRPDCTLPSNWREWGYEPLTVNGPLEPKEDF